MSKKNLKSDFLSNRNKTILAKIAMIAKLVRKSQEKKQQKEKNIVWMKARKEYLRRNIIFGM